MRRWLSYFGRVGDLAIVMSAFPSHIQVIRRSAHLVEVLKEVQNAASDLLLVEAGAGGVTPDGGDAAHRRDLSGGGERSRDSAAEGRGGVGPGAGLGNGASAANDGGAEHGGGDVWDGRD